MRSFAFFLFHSKCQIQCEFYIYSTSQLNVASFPLRSSHMRPVASRLVSIGGLCAQDDLLVDMSHKSFSEIRWMYLLSANCYLSLLLAYFSPLFPEKLFSACPPHTSLIIPSPCQHFLHAPVKELVFLKVLFCVHWSSLSRSVTWKRYPSLWF